MKRHRIRKHSPLDIMIKLMAACGFILVVGSVGYDEMMTEMHLHYPIRGLSFASNMEILWRFHVWYSIKPVHLQNWEIQRKQNIFSPSLL